MHRLLQSIYVLAKINIVVIYVYIHHTQIRYYALTLFLTCYFIHDVIEVFSLSSEIAIVIFKITNAKHIKQNISNAFSN